MLLLAGVRVAMSARPLDFQIVEASSQANSLKPWSQSKKVQVLLSMLRPDKIC